MDIRETAILLFQKNTYLVMVALLLLMGFLHVNIFKKTNASKSKSTYTRKQRIYFLYEKIDAVTDVFYLFKQYYKKKIMLFVMDQGQETKYVNNLLFFQLFLSLVLLVFSSFFVSLWYSQALFSVISLTLPFVIITSFLDHKKRKINQTMPLIIDSFRSAYMTTGKIAESFEVTAEETLNKSKKISLMFRKVAESGSLEDDLLMIKSVYENPWLNIFINLVLNHKQHGGDLVRQLHKLNSSIESSNSMIGKRNKKILMFQALVNNSHD